MNKIEYLLLLISLALLFLGIGVFAVLPSEVSVQEYKTPVLSFLAALTFAALGNIVVGLIQTGVSKEAKRALDGPIESLTSAVNKLEQIQLFYEAGVVGIYPNRASAMRRFFSELEREDQHIDFVGTSMLGSLDPSGDSQDKNALHRLLWRKKRDGVRISVLLMHPAYGEFRERVENRERAAVARDIQGTLRYLLKDPIPESVRRSSSGETLPESADQETFLDKQHVRLYGGVITAYAIFTSRALLANISTLHGPVFNNFALIIEDTEHPTSLFKSFRAEHFAAPWGSEKTIRLDHPILEKLLDLDFSDPMNRFLEGAWPATIPAEPHLPPPDNGRQATASPLPAT
tara:strand:- start:3694 stop:4731 length:1038 start_codon:yes stop_codon:yes gene_type:complete